MNRKSEVNKRKLEKEKLTDSVNMGAVNAILNDERVHMIGNRK